MRPGPPWIERDVAPGGVVLYVYAIDQSWPTATPRLLLIRKLPDADTAMSTAVPDADFVATLVAADTPIVIVTYDGDTGERMKPQGLAGGR